MVSTLAILSTFLAVWFPVYDCMTICFLGILGVPVGRILGCCLRVLHLVAIVREPLFTLYPYYGTRI